MKKEINYNLNGEPLRVEIERRKGSRHLRMRLGHANQLRVSVPWHCPEPMLWDFIESRRDWIAGQLAKAPEPRLLSAFLEQQPWISHEGRRYPLAFSRPKDSGVIAYEMVPSEQQVRLAWGSRCREADLLAMVRQLAKGCIVCRMLDLALDRRIAPPDVSVRDQSSRWGSCAASGRISLNWRLILLPPELMDYVILHELAHLTEFNHSARFWELLDGYDPNRKAHEAALDALSPEIMRVGRSPAR